MGEELELLFTDAAEDDFDFSNTVEVEEPEVDNTEDTKITDEIEPKEETSTSETENEEDFNFEDEEEVEPEVTVKTSGIVSKLTDLGLTSDLELKDEEGNDIDLSNLTSEEESEILQDVIQSEVNKGLESLIGKLSPKLRALNKFVMNGGSMEEYLQGVDTSKVDFFDYDDLPEDKMEGFLKKELKELGYDSDDVEDQIKSLKDNGKLNRFAEKRFSKWKESEKGNRKAIAEQRKERERKNKEADKTFATDINNILDTGKISNIPISKAKAESLKDYMTKPVLGTDKRKMPQVHRDILKAIQDPNKLAMLALISSNDFNLDIIGNTYKNKAKKEVVSKISKQKKEYVSVSDLF